MMLKKFEEFVYIKNQIDVKDTINRKIKKTLSDESKRKKPSEKKVAQIPNWNIY